MLRNLIILIALSFIGWLTLTYIGYVIVHDKTGLAETAQVKNGIWHQNLTKLPLGYFLVIPDMEGGVEVRCSDGSKVRGGYVTTHGRESLTVVGEGTCAKLI